MALNRKATARTIHREASIHTHATQSTCVNDVASMWCWYGEWRCFCDSRESLLCNILSMYIYLAANIHVPTPLYTI